MARDEWTKTWSNSEGGGRLRSSLGGQDHICGKETNGWKDTDPHLATIDFFLYFFLIFFFSFFSFSLSR